MAVFSTNHNRQLYVAKAYNATIDDTSAVGTIGDVKVVDGALHYKYKGADNTLKSDYIQLDNLNYAKAFAAADMVTPLRSYKVILDPNVNGGNVVAGQDYLLRIELDHWVGMSEYDKYFKDAVVHGTSGMTAAQFYQKMVDSLNLAFSREIGATINDNPYLDFAVSGNDIVITEKPQDWTLGIGAQERVYFDVQPTTIYDGSDDVIWGTVANSADTTNKIGNGKKIADFEYFFMGDRGDQYRMQGWPNYIPTKYLVDPTKNYNVFELHYSFVDTGVNSYKSEKDITIVADADGGPLNTLIGNFNTETGLEVATITGE
jgi:hypothetical protein